jgi:NADH-quinone oxidoreductase subunit M
VNGILNWILWLPIIGMVGVILTPKAKENVIKFVTLLTTSITLILSVLLYLKFDTSTADMQFVVKIPWIEQFHINYFIGIDGITMLMTFLNALLFFICTLSSWTVEKNLKSYFALLLMLQSTVFGVFFSLDFFLFYVFLKLSYYLLLRVVLSLYSFLDKICIDLIG